MSIWTYKVITSGKGGFATPALLETFLNQLGTEGWEIIHFQTPQDNALAFTGLARRSTQRDWTLEDAAATAARAEVEKLRAEFEAKFKGVGAGAEEAPESIAAEKAAVDDGFRKPRDTESDLDPEASDEPADDWDKLTKGDELPTFFEAIQPLLRRNQRGPGLSIGVDSLAKKWGMSEEDVVGALRECGFTIPEDEDTRPAYVEYDGDLYWVNVNRRGELWINTKEKSRPVFRTVQANKIASDAGPAADADAASAPDSSPSGSGFPAEGEGQRGNDSQGRSGGSPRAAEKYSGPSAPLPTGPELLEKIRPLMRRNRRGPGGSGSLSFLSRGLKCGEGDLMTAFATLGLTLPAGPEDKPIEVEVGRETWWLNQDKRGGVWINGEETRKNGGQRPEGENAEPAQSEGAPPEAPAGGNGQPEASKSDSVLSAVRLLLKETKTGSWSGETGQLAETLGRGGDEFLQGLTGAGLRIPEKPKEKPVFVEHAGEIFWLNQNAKGQLWLNAKTSKYAQGGDAEKKPRRVRSKD